MKLKLLKHLSVAAAVFGLIVLTATSVMVIALSYQRTIGAPGTGSGQILLPQGITIQAATGNLRVSDGENDRLQIFERGGKFLRTVGESGSGSGQFNWTAGAHYNNGELFVGDFFNSRIQVLTVNTFAQNSSSLQPASVVGIVLVGAGVGVFNFNQSRQWRNS